VVFLARTPDGSELRVVGMSQGVLPVISGTAGGPPMVAPGGRSATLVEPDGSGDLHEAPGALAEAQSLDALLSRIRALVAAKPGVARVKKP
jgi:hypothetical protein